MTYSLGSFKNTDESVNIIIKINSNLEGRAFSIAYLRTGGEIAATTQS